MATTSQWYPQSGGLLNAREWSARVMKVALLTASHVPNVDSHMRYSDVSATEVASGGGYTTGGATLAGKSTSYDPANNEYNLLANDVSWGPGATFQTRYGVIYESDTADKFLWALLDFGALQDIQNGTFLLDWAANLLSIAAGPPV